MNYTEALNYISSVSWKGSVPGLERIRELLGAMQNPQSGLRFIHVAGTNGKGSVCAFLSSILISAGYKTGLFTSPYIEVFNERMRIGGRNIPDDTLAEITDYVRPFADAMSDSPTEFELNTAIALEYFRRKECDVVILEAGMGGELDSTNIIDCPDLAVITSIGLDHTEYLGKTVTEIARTKAGIIKPEGRVVLYRQDMEVTEVISQRCREVSAELYISEPEKIKPGDVSALGQTFFHPAFGNISIAMPGRYELQNAAAAIKAVEVLESIGYRIGADNVRRGFENTRWPARFEVLSLSPVFVVDGAHNPQGAAAAAESWQVLFSGEKSILIFGVLEDKDYRAMLKSLLPLASWVLTVTPLCGRALSAEEAASEVRALAPDVNVRACASAEEAVRKAFSISAGKVPILAAGSLYIAGDIKKEVLRAGHGRA